MVMTQIRVSYYCSMIQYSVGVKSSTEQAALKSKAAPTAVTITSRRIIGNMPTDINCGDVVLYMLHINTWLAYM